MSVSIHKSLVLRPKFQPMANASVPKLKFQPYLNQMLNDSQEFYMSQRNIQVFAFSGLLPLSPFYYYIQWGIGYRLPSHGFATIFLTQTNMALLYCCQAEGDLATGPIRVSVICKALVVDNQSGSALRPLGWLNRKSIQVTTAILRHVSTFIHAHVFLHVISPENVAFVNT